MRSVIRFLGLAATILAIALVVPSALASTPHDLHATKDCSEYTGADPELLHHHRCRIRPIPAGTKVWYTGPIVGSSVFVSSETTLDDGHGNTATGYCIDDNRTGLGTCAFWKGTGKLAGFHAIVTVTVDAAGLYHWDGRYYFTGK